MRYIITLVLSFLILGGIVCLQIFLSKKRNKWLGLIMPLINLVFSVIPTFPLIREMSAFIPQTHEKFDEFGNLVETVTVEPPPGGMAHFIFMIIAVFLIYNISTVILMAIYCVCQKKLKNNSAEYGVYSKGQ